MMLPSGIEYIRRTDSVSQLVEIYRKTDVFVNPSKAESFGMTNVEAMACGKPSVVFDTTACPEIITEQIGSVVPINDIQNMAVEIQRWCELSRTTSSDVISFQCRQRAKQLFSQKQTYQAYVDFYDSLLTK
jgi:glycosyltransferase involved in cell wall biosynthesis